ncbi:restriction endonuclease subunit S [Aeromonas hydrophila]|uniref:restriction endonuclease subunit S n=1 Tax=Aeromonas hydrophila TaxID=644 RepID=UPI0030193D9E
MTRYPTYPNYSPEGTPSTWEKKRLRFVLKMNPSKSEIKLDNTDLVSFVPMDAVGEYGGIRLSEEKELGEIGGGYTYFSDDDVVVAKITPCFENGKGALAKGLTNKTAFGTTELHVMRTNPSLLDPHFLFYLTISDLFRKTGESEMYGAGGQKRVPESFFKDFRAGLPSMEEQQAITRFLNFKTAQIDALIAKQQFLLAKLAEKRTALISHAVTKGLDPSVPMQDSEVQWLGDIPTHWKTTRIKFVARVGNGSTPSRDKPDYWVDGYFPWLNSSVVNQEAVTESDQFVTDLALKECHLPIITPPAVLVGITGQGKTRGMASKLSTIATINQHLAYIKPTTNDIRVDYLLFLFERAYSFLRSESDGGGSTKGAITCEQIANLEIPLPPASEQAAIEVYVADELEMLRNMNQRVANVVEKLQEYRSALITNAVTGKIDVRGFRVPHIDAEVAS